MLESIQLGLISQVQAISEDCGSRIAIWIGNGVVEHLDHAFFACLSRRIRRRSSAERPVLSNSANSASDLFESFTPSTALIFLNVDRPRTMFRLIEAAELFDALWVMSE